jgi:hypothetical protein
MDWTVSLNNINHFILKSELNREDLCVQLRNQ